METQKIKNAVVKTLKRLKSEGKNILGGYFQYDNGNVLLTVSNHNESEYCVCYAYYSQMWNFIVKKEEINE